MPIMRKPLDSHRNIHYNEMSSLSPGAFAWDGVLFLDGELSGTVLCKAREVFDRDRSVVSQRSKV
jgi:hypothetical protein